MWARYCISVIETRIEISVVIYQHVKQVFLNKVKIVSSERTEDLLIVVWVQVWLWV